MPRDWVMVRCRWRCWKPRSIAGLQRRRPVSYTHLDVYKRQVPALFEQAIANMREGVQAGVVQPRLLMQKVLPQLDGVVSDDPQKTPFWGPISNLPADFSDADKKRLTEAYTAMINQQLVPAFRGLRTYLAVSYTHLDVYKRQFQVTVVLEDRVFALEGELRVGAHVLEE